MKRNSLSSSRRSRTAQAGFTLLEVMVAVLLLTIGIFGFAKMQALAVSSTQTASSRSIVAMQANSLAAAMHGNREFWRDGGLVVRTFSTNGAVVTDATGVVSTIPSGECTSATKPSGPKCSLQQMAALEVGIWARNLDALLPGTTSLVNCSSSSDVPVSCVLTIQWNDRYINSTKTAAGTGFGTSGARSYTLYIEP
ncbi:MULTISPECIES: type IV pilus modification protein PilV [unclassified Variovorax]|uniref:type IV pilus modification protein PilV n=1 Tax=unclassified Variovorax TaxID=663243 RepID=UPI001BD5CB8A|nr:MULTISPECIES: type IV pilus modification protein PilV [unclassified Variovorax]